MVTLRPPFYGALRPNKLDGRFAPERNQATHSHGRLPVKRFFRSLGLAHQTDAQPMADPQGAVVSKHPSLEMIGDYATANLSPGASLLVETHVELCSACAMSLKAISETPRWGGVEVEVMEPAAVSTAAPALSGGGSAPDPIELGLPPTLRSLPYGRWRGGPLLNWRLSRVEGASGLGETLYLLKAAPGAALPFSAGSAAEYALILQGSASSGTETLSRGAFADLSESQLARPMAHPQLGCICLLVSSEPIPATPAAWLRTVIQRRSVRQAL